MERSLLVLFTHGSRDPRWLEPFEKLEEALRAEVGPDKVRLAHMEVSPPTLLEVASEAAARGLKKLRLLPLFMAGGGHVAHTIPEQVRQVEAALPGLDIEILPAVGEDPKVIELVYQIALEAVR